MAENIKIGSLEDLRQIRRDDTVVLPAKLQPEARTLTMRLAKAYNAQFRAEFIEDPQNGRLISIKRIS